MFSACPVAYENKTFTAPANFGQYVRLAIRNGLGATSAIGGGDGGTVLNEQQGRIWIQAFVKEGTGTGPIRVLMDTALNIFKDARFNGIKCYAPEVQYVGPDGTGYFQLNGSVFYRRFD